MIVAQNRAKVFEEVCQVAEEIIAIHLKDGRKLPDGRPKKYSGKFILRVSPGLHEALALEAERTCKSLNAVAADALRAGLAID